MKRMLSCILFAVILALALGGCGHQGKQHKAMMDMDTKSYDAHFPDMDTNGDNLVSWAEFENQFTDAEKDVYEAIDLNKDGNLVDKEWQDFRSGSGFEIQKSE